MRSARDLKMLYDTNLEHSSIAKHEQRNVLVQREVTTQSHLTMKKITTNPGLDGGLSPT